MLYSDDEYKMFAEELEGSSIGTVWSAMRADNFGKDELSYKEKCDYILKNENDEDLKKNIDFIINQLCKNL